MPPAWRERRHEHHQGASCRVGPTEPEPADAYQVKTETAKMQGLLTGDGVRSLFTSFVDNFRNFSAVAIILVVMIGVGLPAMGATLAKRRRQPVHARAGGRPRELPLHARRDGDCRVVRDLGRVAVRSR
jgi:AbgT putative transporter family